VDRKRRAARTVALRRVLRALRREQNLTQKELADLLDVPQSYVSKYEAGERRLDLAELEAIANALGIGLTTIVRRFESKPESSERTK